MGLWSWLESDGDHDHGKDGMVAMAKWDGGQGHVLAVATVKAAPSLPRSLVRKDQLWSWGFQQGPLGALYVCGDPCVVMGTYHIGVVSLSIPGHQSTTTWP